MEANLENPMSGSGLKKGHKGSVETHEGVRNTGVGGL